MILTILFVTLLLISITIFWYNYENWDSDVVMCFSCVIGFVSLVGTLTTLIMILMVQIPKDVDYERTKYERTQLIEQYEQGNQYAYDSIIEFDKQLLSIKKWANNPFTNWLYNQRIANEVDFILYEDVDFEIGGN